MATTVQTPAAKAPAKGTPMSSTRKTALVAGIFYLITFISIPTLALYGPVKNHQNWILSSGGHTAVLVGGFLEVIVALAGIGTAVTLYPVVKRQNEGAALGFVTARVLEASMIFAGVVSLLSLVTLRQAGRDRSNRGRAGHHRRVARRGLQLDVPALTEPHAGHQRTAAGLLAVPVPARAPHHSRASGSSAPRSSSAPSSPRCSAASSCQLPRARRSPGGCLGAVAGRVAGRQGLPALPDHRRNGRRGQHAARLPGGRGLTSRQDDTAGPPRGPAVSVPQPVACAEAVLHRCRAHRTRRTGRIATAPMIAHSPATVYSTP